MKHLLLILGALALAVVIFFVAYIKGHSDGVRQASVGGLFLDIVIFEDFERHGAERAKSRLGTFLTSRYDSMNARSSWLQSWLEWRKVDTEVHYEQRRGRAEEIARQYRDGMPTPERVKAALEEARPDVKFEFKSE